MNRHPTPSFSNIDRTELEPNEIFEIGIKQWKIDSFYVAYSGGKDSGIALDLCAKNFPKQFKGVVFVNTGIATTQTIEFVKKFCNDRNYPLFILRPEEVIRKKNDGLIYSYENLVLKWGFPTVQGHNVTMRWLKYFPMRQFLEDRIKAGEKPALISGIRKKESARRFRNKNSSATAINRDGKMIFVKPLYFKDNNWVMKYFIENDIKRSPVYETLHISGDCLCGAFAQRDEAKLLQMFHPEVFEKIKQIEKKLKEKNHKYAKKYGTWGNSNIQSIEEIEAQSTLEEFVCNECFFDNKKEKTLDNKRFDDELKDIEEKLNHLSSKS